MRECPYAFRVGKAGRDVAILHRQVIFLRGLAQDTFLRFDVGDEVNRLVVHVQQEEWFHRTRSAGRSVFPSMTSMAPARPYVCVPTKSFIQTGSSTEKHFSPRTGSYETT